MNPYLLPALELGPAIVKRLLGQIPASRLDEAIVEGRFTPREAIAHLADWEPIMRERIQAAVSTPGVGIEVYDEGEMAVQNGYATTEPLEQCTLFERERAKTAAFAKNLGAADWVKTVQHPERGTLSAEDLTNLLLGHDLYHIEQLTAYLTGSGP